MPPNNNLPGESFALLRTDPEWMRPNLPELFAGFNRLVKMGSLLSLEGLGSPL
jgi:hypothetical protein